jgi:hypothetical protein
MRTLIAALTVAAAIVIGPNAEAQVVVPANAVVGTEYVVGAPYPGYNAGVAIPYYGFGYWGTYLPPYSYYAAPYPLPARYYVGYGSNDFPFYGRPYGHPYDPWTWPYMSGGYQRALARYFYPPL